MLSGSEEQGSSESWGLQEGAGGHLRLGESSSAGGPARTRLGTLFGHLLAG